LWKAADWRTASPFNSRRRRKYRQDEQPFVSGIPDAVRHTLRLRKDRMTA
jgi:hypothetical protein